MILCSAHWPHYSCSFSGLTQNRQHVPLSFRRFLTSSFICEHKWTFNGCNIIMPGSSCNKGEWLPVGGDTPIHSFHLLLKSFFSVAFCVISAVVFLLVSLVFRLCEPCMLDPKCGFCYRENDSALLASSCVPVNKASTEHAAWGR